MDLTLSDSELAFQAEAREWLDKSRCRYWLSVGAQPSEKVAVILKRHGVVKPAPGEPWQLPEEPKPAPAAGEAPTGPTPPAS